MKITALLENTAGNAATRCEHGLSLYMETSSHRILFDMGQSDLFLKNAEALGIDLAKVDLAVLSHGHYDHGGGLSAFLEINKNASVYLSRHAFGDYYNADGKYIGLDDSLQSNSCLILTADTQSIGEGLTLYSKNSAPRNHSLGAFGLTERIGNELLPDRFLHEQYLFIEENSRRILISGCSHKGILDLVNWFSPDVLVGGFHLMKMTIGDSLSRVADELDAHTTEYYTCHCTGMEQFAFLQPRMKRLHYLACGDTIEI